MSGISGGKLISLSEDGGDDERAALPRWDLGFGFVLASLRRLLVPGANACSAVLAALR